MIAVSCGHIETVDLLLRGKGIKVNERMDKGLTAMHYAVWFGFTDCASRLCKHSDIVLDMPAHDGQTPLHYAMTFGRRDIAKMLLKYRLQKTEQNVFYKRYFCILSKIVILLLQDGEKYIILTLKIYDISHIKYFAVPL